MPIDDIRLIKHNMGGVNRPDEPAFGPFRLDAIFRVPEFMDVALTFIYGREEIVVRGKTKEALEEFVTTNHLRDHPRLQRLEITEPEKAEIEQNLREQWEDEKHWSRRDYRKKTINNNMGYES